MTRAVADITGQKMEIICVDKDFKGSKEYKEMNMLDQMPILSTSEGSLQDHSAICKYLCTLSNSHMGKTAAERSQVDQWISFRNSSLVNTCQTINDGVFGTGKVTDADFKAANTELGNHLRVMNTALDGKKWLVGDDVTCADIVCAMTLKFAFQTVVDAGKRKAPVCKNTAAWAQLCFDLPAIKKICGNIQMCAKPMKGFNLVVEKKEEKKKEAPKVAAAPAKKEEKVKDNVESLPPTTFELYDFKTLFVNHKDMKGAGVDTWYKMLDWDGWSFWHVHYDIYEGEGAKMHITNNLLGGFLNRAEHVSKYTFAKMAVIGEEPNLQIEGVWLFRGQEVPDGLAKEHP